MPRARLAILVVALLALAGCTAAPTPLPPTPTGSPSASPSATPAPGDDGVLRIGALVPRSGATDFLGPGLLAGVNAAVAEVNAAGGVGGHPVEVVVADSGDATTKTAEAAFADLVAKGVDAVVGPASSALAARLLPLAAEAGVPLVSPAAISPALAALTPRGWLFRTVPDYAHQAVVLGPALVAAEQPRVVLVASADAYGQSLPGPLARSLRAAGGELLATERTGSDAAALVARVAERKPDAVVLATPDNGAGTRDLVDRLSAAGLGGAHLWLTSLDLADYSQSLAAGRLDGAHGVMEGAEPTGALLDALKRADPQLSITRYAPESYDATMLVALAAAVAGDHGAALAAAIGEVSVGGVKCTSFAECAGVVADGDLPDYDGASGPLDLDETGGVTRGSFGSYRYGAGNTATRAATLIG